MTYGAITVSRWLAHRAAGEYLHVFLNGEDVTTECVHADDELGLVVRFVRDAQGQIRIAGGRALLEYTFGDVEVLPEPMECFADVPRS